MADNFYKVLTDAINDVSEHGFDSQERIDRWMELLRKAAEATLTPPHVIEKQLRDALSAIYRKMVERGGLFRINPGVSRFTLDKVRPALRVQLDARIMASANLIKLNRRSAIEKTLQRFSGWSTSIPKGGSRVVDKAAEKKNVRKSLGSLPFEERRVLIDQGHKFTAALSETLARGGDAIALIWHSHWRQPGYNYREDHKERDEKVYALRGSWAIEQRLMKRGPNPYYDEITAVGEEIFCRCYAQWLFNLRDIPDDMLTQKGREVLQDARDRAKELSARADSQDNPEELSPAVMAEVRRLDRMGFLKSVKAVRMVDDRSKWHASYDPETREITVERKLARAPVSEQVHVLLHEAGHRGQDAAPDLYALFKRDQLNQIGYFEEMANAVHLRDFRHTGEVDSVAAETFAESYGRFCAGLEMPERLRAFWTEAVAAVRAAA